MVEANAYAAADVRVLETHELIRKRPGMYVGDVHDGSGLHHLLWELVGNALDEHLAGHASRIRVSIEGDLMEVEDDGRGMPVEMTHLGLPFLELSLTRLHHGPTLDGHQPHVHVSPSGFGLGLAVVNALAAELEVEVRRNGFAWRQRFERGVAVSPLERGERSERTGTRIRFRADRTIFHEPSFERSAIRERLQELAIWNPSLTFDLMGERISEPRGTARWIERMAAEHDVAGELDVFVTRAARNDVWVEIAAAWSPGPCWELRSFVGQNCTPEGGTHERGFWRGLVAALIQRRPRAFTRAPRAARLRQRLAPGLLGVVHVGLRHPRFGAPTRARLESTEAMAAVHDQMLDGFGSHLAHRPRLLRELLARLDR